MKTEYHSGDLVVAAEELICFGGRRVPKGMRGKVISVTWNEHSGFNKNLVRFKCGTLSSLTWVDLDPYVPHALEQLAEQAE